MELAVAGVVSLFLGLVMRVGGGVAVVVVVGGFSSGGEPCRDGMVDGGGAAGSNVMGLVCLWGTVGSVSIGGLLQANGLARLAADGRESGTDARKVKN